MKAFSKAKCVKITQFLVKGQPFNPKQTNFEQTVQIVIVYLVIC